jgi:hypothetical protein
MLPITDWLIIKPVASGRRSDLFVKIGRRRRTAQRTFPDNEEDAPWPNGPAPTAKSVKEPLPPRLPDGTTSSWKAQLEVAWHGNLAT